MEPLAGAGQVSRVVDAFTLRAGANTAEWAVGFDEAGRFTAERCESLDDLLSRARRALSFQELSVGRRTIGLRSVHVFEAALLEQTADCPGVDDPVYLYGTLVGPLSVGGPPPHRIEGQLVTTRSDLLSAFVAGVRWPFLCRDETANEIEPIFSALVDADRTGGARGALIVYPIVTGEPDTADLFLGNDEIVNQMLYDLLTALWQDVAREDGGAYRDAREIPPTTSRRGTVDYLELAAEALQMSSLWPSARVLVLNQKVAVPPRQTPPPDAALPSSRWRRVFRLGARRPRGWIESFLAKHLRGATPVILTPRSEERAAASADEAAVRARWANKTAMEILAMLDRTQG